jgi:hypothetical protein
MHGPLRVYQGKGFGKFFWLAVMCAAMCVLIVQIFELIDLYTNESPSTSVTFVIPDGGMTFPSMTICNYNPIRQSYIDGLSVLIRVTFA